MKQFFVFLLLALPAILARAEDPKLPTPVRTNPFQSAPSALPGLPPMPREMPQPALPGNALLPVQPEPDTRRQFDTVAVVSISANEVALRFTNSAFTALSPGVLPTQGNARYSRTLFLKNNAVFYLSGKKFRVQLSGLRVQILHGKNDVVFDGDIDSPPMSLITDRDTPGIHK